MPEYHRKLWGHTSYQNYILSSCDLQEGPPLDLVIHTHLHSGLTIRAWPLMWLEWDVNATAILLVEARPKKPVSCMDWKSLMLAHVLTRLTHNTFSLVHRSNLPSLSYLSQCNIERSGVGLGTRLQDVYTNRCSTIPSYTCTWTTTYEANCCKFAECRHQGWVESAGEKLHVQHYCIKQSD